VSEHAGWLDKLGDLGAPTLLGMGIFAIGGAMLGYLTVKWGWRARRAPGLVAAAQVMTDCCASPASTSTCWPVMPSLSSAARNSVVRATWPASSRIFKHC
jgi:hypothetical protein